MRTEFAARATRLPATIRSFNARDAIPPPRRTRDTVAYAARDITASIAIRAIHRGEGLETSGRVGPPISLDRANEIRAFYCSGAGSGGVCTGACGDSAAPAPVR